MLSDKQGGIKYYFFILWYDSTWDWTPNTLIADITNQFLEAFNNMQMNEQSCI